ncbi:MAG TPA: hypothetical protein DCQ51_09895 [Planktothrix sp. UBA8407]|jgi:hypothetical protein|nr:hypothetical protein [Planktothrix sp. UBA8407]
MAAGKLSFTQIEYRLRENGQYETTKVSVERTEGTTGIVSVKVTNSSASSLGRATRKLDFLAENPTTSTGSAQLLTWADGEGGIKTLDFTIIMENLVEGDEFVPLSLGSFKGGAVAGDIPKCNLIIVDDDSAIGIQGIQGEKGDKGDKGDTGLGLEGINYKGIWNQNTPYSKNDAVFAMGDTYLCLQDVTAGNDPLMNPSSWVLIAYGPQYFTLAGNHGTLRHYLYTCSLAPTPNMTRTFVHGLNTNILKGFFGILKSPTPLGTFGSNVNILPGGFPVPGFDYYLAVNSSEIVLSTTDNSSSVLSRQVFVTLIL